MNDQVNVGTKHSSGVGTESPRPAQEANSQCAARYEDGKSFCVLPQGHSGLHECEWFRWSQWV